MCAANGKNNSDKSPYKSINSYFLHLKTGLWRIVKIPFSLSVLKLVCQNKVTRQKHIDKIYYAENFRPTYEKEQDEHNDVNHALGAKHYRKPYKTFNNPTNEWNEKKYGFQKYRLTVKPFVKIHF